MSRRREIWIDIAKGIGIIAVVAGHTGFDFFHHYFFWFHMPLFFILSGYLYKPVNNRPSLISWIKRRTKQLLIPYISFGLLISLLIYMGNGNHSLLINNILNLLYSGQQVKLIFTVFWFILTLYITQLLFALLNYYFKDKTLLIIVFLCYCAAQFISHMPLISLPWNADVALISIAYYSIGFYSKKFFPRYINNLYLFISLFIIMGILALADRLGFIYYVLDMKAKLYTHPILDVIIPVATVILICQVSYWLSRFPVSRFFLILGTSSLTIMYLHRPLNMLFKHYFESSFIYQGTLSVLTAIIIGLFLSLTIALLFEKNKYTGKLFLGKFTS